RPLAQQGPLLYIQKFQRRPLTGEDLMRFGTLTPEAFEILQGVLRASLNIVITGAAITGKTALMNALAATIPPEQFIAVIESNTELYLSHPQCIFLQTRPPNIEGKGEVPAHALAQQVVRFQPEYIILGG